MKRILLLAVTISLFGHITAQNDTWKVYLQGHAVKSIAFENQYVWVATDGFLVRLNKTFDKGTIYYSYPYKDENGSHYLLEIDKKGVKWLARSEYNPGYSSIYEQRKSSIYSFDVNQWKLVKSIGYGGITSLAIDKNNNKWIATVGNDGLFVIEKDGCVQYTPDNSGLVYNDVSQVVSDKDGNIWVLNLEYGPMLSADIALIKYDGNNWITYYSGEGHSIDFITIDNQGNPLLSLHKIDTISNSLLPYSFYTDPLPPSLRVGSLPIIEGEDKLWFSIREQISLGSYQAKGIASLSDSGWSFYTTANSELPSDTVYQIAIDADGTKWIGTAKGLAAFNENGLLSTDEYSKLMNDIVLFPNPSKDYITLKLPEGFQNSTVDIFNIVGKKIKTFSINGTRNQLDVSLLPSGVYFVHIQLDENHFTKKFIKQ